LVFFVEREDHAGFDFVGVLQRNEAADERGFPRSRGRCRGRIAAEGGFVIGDVNSWLWARLRRFRGLPAGAD